MIDLKFTTAGDYFMMRVENTSTQIYKRDSTGKVRVWWYDTGTDGQGWAWRVNSGLKDGKIVQSEWKFVEQKNIGKVNETSLEEQSILEAEAEKKKKLERGYFSNIEDIDSFEKVKPMLAAKYENAKFNWDKEVYFSQPKLDGIRCVARKDGLWTRQGKEIVSVPHIMDDLKEFFNIFPDAVLDGELYNHDLRDDFNKITSLVRKTKPTSADIEEAATLVQYHVYDLVRSDKMVFGDRITKLSVEPTFGDSIKIVKTNRVKNQEEMDNFYGDYLQDGFEGQMIRLDKSYEQNKRSKSLLKRKEFLTDEFKVIAVEEGKGNWSGHIKRFVLQLEDGTQFGAGVRGTQEVMKALFESNEKPEWATLRYFTPTPDGIPRFPVVIDWGVGQRED